MSTRTPRNVANNRPLRRHPRMRSGADAPNQLTWEMRNAADGGSSAHALAETNICKIHTRRVRNANRYRLPPSLAPWLPGYLADK